MKPRLSIFAIILIGLFTIAVAASRAEEAVAAVKYEYATIRWGGRDNTHIIRPGGKVEFVAGQLRDFKKPERADDRSFYMNLVMNGMANDGWEVCTMTSDDIVMKRVRKP